jgi:FKBP-type peptidyl-prolyl cis-trans isomerase FkpA/FKBP-type peptidyl-prolyl cis-trans isomerase FklB
MKKAQLEEEKVAEEAKAASAAWLKEKEAEDGVKKTESGLLYKVITAGKGDKPSATDTVKVDYEGSLSDGTVFDSSYKRGEAITFPLNGVIPGWTEGLQLMPVGSKYELYIPADLAYGPGGTGPIPPNAALKFVVELHSIEKPEAAK